MLRRTIWILAALGCGDHHGAAVDATGAIDAAVADAAVAPAGTVGLYEAETMTLIGSAMIVGATDHSDRAVGELGGEASARQAVTLNAPGDAISFTVQPAHAGASAVVVRYSIPDAATGGGQRATATLTAGTTTTSLALTSRYAWLYGGVAAGTKLYNTPSNASTYAGSTAPTHLYDEVQVMLPASLAAGATVTLGLGIGATLPVTIDFVELEVVAPASAAPAGFLSLTDPSCGAIALDTGMTGRVFDGADDSSYASGFNAVIGTNPFNPTTPAGVQPAGTQEKDYYTSVPGDVLRDDVGTAASGGMTMLALADHNLQSIVTCIGLVSAPASGYAGVWIPPGRFYVRGSAVLPSNLTIRGAGIWHSKLVAVDTAPPTSVTNPANGNMGIAGASGNFRFTSVGGGSSQVTLSDFAMFGNLTQRDDVDQLAPIGVVGQFANSTFARLWIEHYEQALVMNQSSTGVTFDDVRARNTFADGLDFYGGTSNSLIRASESRGNGDDGFAIWSQSATSVSTGNRVQGCVARLQWFGNGFAAYGGANVTFETIAAYDSLTGAGLKLATEFVPTALPSTFEMTGVTVTDASLYRCGGNANNAMLGAALIGAEVENIDGMTLDQVRVDSPTFGAFDVRFLSNVGAVATPGSVKNLSITNAEVIGASTCARVTSVVTGNAQLGNVCSCPAANAATAACVADDQSTTFTITGNTCTAATCPAF